MPYTRVWTRNNPPGSQAANTADDEIRNLRQDLEERMAALVTGWSTSGPTDPVVPIPAILGNVTGKKLYLHWSDFQSFDNNDTVTRRTAYGSPYATAQAASQWLHGLRLPVGAVLQRVGLLCDPQGNALTLNVSRLTYTTVTPGLTTVGQTSASSTGITEIVLTPGHTILTANVYFIWLSMPANARLYGAEIQYDVTDSTMTL